MNEYFERYREYKINVEGKSTKYMTMVLITLKEVCNFFQIEDIDNFCKLTSKDISNWLISLAKNNISNSTRNTKLSYLKSFFDYLEFIERKEIDRYIKRIPNAKVPYRVKNYPNSLDMDRLIENTKSQRTKAMIVVIRNTGVRFSELIQITCKDIENGYANIIGKGNKERTIYFNLNTQRVCKRYINSRRKKIVERTGVDTDLLFINKFGKVVSEVAFCEELKKSAMNSGITWYKEMTPHKLRHGFASEQIKENGADLATIRDALGHTNIATTNRYLHTEENLVKQMMTKE